MRLTWDKLEEREYETGVDHGVLYLPDKETNQYTKGVAWNGLTEVNETPTGAESNPQYADNIKYLDLYSAEEFGATISAFTYPDEFEQCDGSAELVPGVVIGQQDRKPFGFCYRTKKGDSLEGQDKGYKLHIVYGCRVSPSDRTYSTINDSPEAVNFSWELTTTPIDVSGFKPTATIVIDSTKVDAAKLTALEDILYGKDAEGEGTGTDPRLPMPLEIKSMFENTAG